MICSTPLRLQASCDTWYLLPISSFLAELSLMRSPLVFDSFPFPITIYFSFPTPLGLQKQHLPLDDGIVFQHAQWPGCAGSDECFEVAGQCHADETDGDGAGFGAFCHCSGEGEEKLIVGAVRW